MSPVLEFAQPFHQHDTELKDAPNTETLQEALAEFAKLALGQGRSEQAKWQELRVRNFRSRKYRLRSDLIVVMEERQEAFVAHSHDTGQYGYGISEDQALANLCAVLEDYYELLVEDEGKLSSLLDGHLVYLRSVLEECA